ncbi:putative ATP-binding ABC transporter protein [Helicobacter pylori Hp P-23]|uniref:ATP-binding ABC transporter protein n=2 Tax=Helicobacter pylori TaxID=210 RepID=A0AB33XFM5_HELPX|nr:putative ATP-binding ABC transporter protein [Helicobacter pylori Hp H-30]EJB60961.1 putative ATP-binding ABC transporter protein [Helicobacter pylori Hp H-42]EJB84957.1 putative ATP-binding ABC transporter protein [Helicobacter pylori Hp H-10]EJB93154.1 putative ATP-binding ABC transporter protein [Helicobacter pylori Hp H-23]EJC00674.1 putative ATP-binding ABC transporter protein [Helicobacter pylori Hp P-3]EJC12290.1 putative ATP-binding ABC transporter protein [Helicobacter pylori Hp P-
MLFLICFFIESFIASQKAIPIIDIPTFLKTFFSFAVFTNFIIIVASITKTLIIGI